ncbi:hypothetical protein GCM10009582_33850 [Arthrobacter flavus]
MASRHHSVFETKDKITHKAHTIFDEQAKDSVCGDCNHVWMQVMDTEAKTLVHDLARGSRPTIIEGEAALLSTWVTKVGLVRTLLNRKGLANAHEVVFRRFFEHNAPTMPHMVQIGSLDFPARASSNTSLNHLVVQRKAGIPLSDPFLLDSANVVTLGIGRLFLQVGLTSKSDYSLNACTSNLRAVRSRFPGRVILLGLGEDTETPQQTLSAEDFAIAAEPGDLTGAIKFQGLPQRLEAPRPE